MTTTQQPTDVQTPSHTFMDMKPPLLPRQSTGDVLSFTQIIADRLEPGQTVWDYFSPPPLSHEPEGVTPNTTDSTATSNTAKDVTSRAQKRRSFVQSFRNSMASLSQLISASKSGKQAGVSTGLHYNILVLGSGSAPLASTLYKISSLLPNTNKIGHYQEVSGFFVAHFRSNGSSSCSPKRSAEMNDTEYKKSSDSSRTSGSTDSKNLSKERLERIDQEQGENQEPSPIRRASGDSDATLHNPSLLLHVPGLDTPRMSNSSEDDDKATLCRKPSTSTLTADPEVSEEPLSMSANTTLSVHAFSLDTTWPVPRLLAQTFWFPHAHGIIYIVDATRKNDPRGIDHLVSARELLATLVTDPNFKRKDIPVVVFANKAGLDDDCFRVDEIAEILGCEEWDERATVTSASTKSTNGSPTQRPWCVKSTRSDGEGEGLRESVEWLKSRMGEVWKS